MGFVFGFFCADWSSILGKRKQQQDFVLHLFLCMYKHICAFKDQTVDQAPTQLELCQSMYLNTWGTQSGETTPGPKGKTD